MHDVDARPAGAGASIGVRYAALGDSSTEGMCDPDGNGGWIGWSQRLAQRHAQVHGRVLWANLAVRGMTCREILATQLAPAVALRPTVATVFGGMNDLLRFVRPVDDVLADLTTMWATMQATGATVATLTLPDLGEVVPIARPLRSRVQRLNEGIRASAAHGVVVVDLAASRNATDPRLWAQDRLHANAEGHRRIAEALAAALGLPSEGWDADLPGDPVAWDRDDHRQWRRAHLYPWIGRRLRGVSAGNELGPRHPEWTTMTADATADTTADGAMDATAAPGFTQR